MRVSELAPATGFPLVQGFVAQVLDMQFADVRAMLQLPRPDIGITAGCNFAIVSSLCNLISGISTTIYMPAALLGTLRSTGYGDKKAFKGLVGDFFPYTPPGAGDFAEQLYQLCRNPMVHSAGLMDAPAPVVAFSRVYHAVHDGTGWTDQELEDLERPDRPNTIPNPGIMIDPQRWTLHCDSFYFDVIAMLRDLNINPAQMQAAESRFTQNVYNWRR
jgi:hypothetical protein